MNVTISVLLARFILGSLVVLVGLAVFAHAAAARKAKSVMFAAIAVIVVGAWIAFGGRITISPTKIEATGSEQALADTTSALKNPSNAEHPDNVFQQYSKGVRIWWTLLQTRIELRSSLRAACIANGSILRPDASFTEIIGEATGRGLLRDEVLVDTLKNIREYTFWSEWRGGRIPNDSQIKYVLDNGPAAVSAVTAIKTAECASATSASRLIPECASDKSEPVDEKSTRK